MEEREKQNIVPNSLEEKMRRRSREMVARYKRNQHEKLELIKLNIGGCRYTTTKHTLTRIPGSFFSALLVGDRI